MNIIKQAVHQWVETWYNNRQLFWVELIGTVIGMSCALVIDFLAVHPPMLIILAGYCISAVLLAYASNVRQSPFMFLLMAFYAIAATIGLLSLLF